MAQTYWNLNGFKGRCLLLKDIIKCLLIKLLDFYYVLHNY